ncbi:mCG145412, partial [Mus musculus]
QMRGGADGSAEKAKQTFNLNLAPWNVGLGSLSISDCLLPFNCPRLPRLYSGKTVVQSHPPVSKPELKSQEGVRRSRGLLGVKCSPTLRGCCCPRAPKMGCKGLGTGTW